MLITSPMMLPKSGGLDPVEASTTADEQQCLFSVLVEGNRSSNTFSMFVESLGWY
jgi:hypothetical protein